MKSRISKLVSWMKGRSKKTLLIGCLAAAVIIILAAALIPVDSGRKGADGKPIRTSLLGKLLNGPDKKADSKSSASTTSTATRDRNSELTRSVKKVERQYERIDKDVKRGELTADQAKLIKQKLDETKEYLGSIADKPKPEQESLIEKKQLELRKWARENDIRLSYVRL